MNHKPANDQRLSHRRGLLRPARCALAWWRRRPAGQATGRDLVIRQFLDLSTAHLRRQTCDNLGSYEGITAYHTTYGWLMYAPDNARVRAEEYDWPAELAPIITLARAHGCEYVLFDADAEQTRRLPAYDW
jgi:hypothetical protein